MTYACGSFYIWRSDLIGEELWTKELILWQRTRGIHRLPSWGGWQIHGLDSICSHGEEERTRLASSYWLKKMNSWIVENILSTEDKVLEKWTAACRSAVWKSANISLNWVPVELSFAYIRMHFVKHIIGLQNCHIYLPIQIPWKDLIVANLLKNDGTWVQYSEKRRLFR